MNPKVSIIVPVYNMERYLKRCLNSLLNQTFSDIEIIAVNDGSTDGTENILNEYLQRDNRIKVITQKNGGVSSARNEGIKAAQGEFIGFVDPDDWVNEKMYETMYTEAAAGKTDIVMCSYVREFGSHSKEKNFEVDTFRYEGNEVHKMMRRLVGPLGDETANPELLDAWGTVWSKLYRVDLIQENDLQFVDLKEIGTNEDTLFNIQAFYYASSFHFLNKPFYHYWRGNAHSITTGYKANLLEQWFTLYKQIEEFLENNNMEDEHFTALNNRICLNVLGLGLNTMSADTLSERMKIKSIKAFLEHERIKQSFYTFELTHFPINWKVFFLFAKVHSATGLYCMLAVIEILRKRLR
ncbi:glycosyltransferase [Domibacillus sp.]|uniref:glycosyltransferase family 2 protein n=1 Tax=Domibacillus sp. TaxID=1969783 RepID=UPI00281110D6|nr:glycosyltransferase [Domibacillus sp.]